jgi:hypothetical protein
MRKHLLAWSLLAIPVVIFGLLLFPSVHWPLLGLLRRESFYKDRPTSYWRTEITRVDMPRSDIWARLLGFLPRPQREQPLMDCDRSVVPVLLELLGDDDARVRNYALLALRQLILRMDPGPSPEDASVQRAILRGFHDPDRQVRSIAGGCLYYWDVRTRPSERPEFTALVVREMIELLASGSAQDRVMAVEELNKLATVRLAKVGPAVKPAVPALRRRLREDNDRWVRRCAAEALGHIGAPDATEALPELLRAFNEEDPMIRTTADGALSAIDPESWEALAGRGPFNPPYAH